MRFLTFIGKLFLVSSIILQAFLLYHHKKEADQFNKHLTTATAQYQCLAQYKQHFLQYLRLAIAGLLASSALILLFRYWLVKLPALIGLIILLWVEHHAVIHKVWTLSVSFEILDNVGLWHSLGVVGAIIYLLGAECSSVKTSKPNSAAQNKGSQGSEEKPKLAQSNQAKGKSKKQ